MELTLSSHPRNISQIEPFVQQLVNQFEIKEELFGNILVALTEAVSNAIIHGNNAKASKQVLIRSCCMDTSIKFTVADEGAGFDHSALPDPTAPENILKPGGRGVFLIQQLSDAVTYLEEGRVVEMRFKL